ncbi:MAG: nucleoside monophosphate kinase [Patescibacteria group bacterium]
MIILLLGPQGSGKGTQAKLLVTKFGFYYLSAGDLMREINKTNPELRDMMSKGIFVPDEMTFGFIVKHLEEKVIFDNVILDGFPRSIKQYELMKDWLSKKGTKISLCINLEIPEEETIRRLSARRMDPETGKIYNLITDPPGDDVDQSKLVQREDDKPESIKKRLGWTKSITGPLLELLKQDMDLLNINGERPVLEIQKDLVAAIEEKLKNEAGSN